MKDVSLNLAGAITLKCALALYNSTADIRVHPRASAVKKIPKS
jgi:hypothetical protein